MKYILMKVTHDMQVVLHRHLLRTSAASIVDTLFINLVGFFHLSRGLNGLFNREYHRTTILDPSQEVYNKLKSGLEVDNSQNSEPVSLSPGERTGLVWESDFLPDFLFCFYRSH